jgi:hypothetical protein
VPHLYARVWPTDGQPAGPALEEALARLAPVREAVGFTHGGWLAAEPDADGGEVLALALPEEDPDALVREVRASLGLSKAIALHDPSWWVQVWDDLGLVEGTFGRPLALFGGVAVDDDGRYDDDLETRLTEAVAKVTLPGLDLGFPPGVSEEALTAMDHGPTDDQRVDAGFVGRMVAAVDRCARWRRVAAAEALAVVLDEVHDDVLRPILLEGWADHAPAARVRLQGTLERMEDRGAARDIGLDLLFSVPKGHALEDAAAALVPWAGDPELVAVLSAAVDDPEAVPGPGTRVEGACADLLLRTDEGGRAVARRARRDRAGEPFTWWAARKLLVAPPPCAIPTLRLYGRPSGGPPPWLAEGLRAAGLEPAREEEAPALIEEEAHLLGPEA